LTNLNFGRDFTAERAENAEIFNGFLRDLRDLGGKRLNLSVNQAALRKVGF
jgi:hypothetical protein